MVARADERLAAAGIRATRQRVEVLEAMAGERHDVTAQALTQRLQTSGSGIGLATVYRTLNLLADAGLLDRIPHGAEQCYRLCSPGHHHHLTCRGCHAVVEIRDCTVDDWARTTGDSLGFIEIAHSLELVGTCASCAAS